jgi:HK97 family phage major capsid protein
MPTLKQNLATRASLVAEMRQMIEAAETAGRDFNAEEATTYADKEKALKELNARIERQQSLQATETASAASMGAVGNRGPPEDDDTVPAPRAAQRSQVRRVVKDDFVETEENAGFRSVGEFFACVAYNGREDSRLQHLHRDFTASQDMRAALDGSQMNMGNGSQGGFMVPNQFRSELLAVPAQGEIIRPRARVIPAGSPPDAAITMPALDQTGDAPGNSYGGVTMAWIGEGVTKPKTQAALRQVTLQPWEVAGSLDITDKLLRNWQAAGSVLTTLLRGALSQAKEYAYYRGDGVAKPLGVLSANARIKVKRKTANQVNYDDLVVMVSRFLLSGGGRPAWIANQAILPSLLKMTDPEGHYIFQPSAREGVPSTLLGYPIEWSQNAPALGSEGDIGLYDLSYYLIKDGSGPFVAASEHAAFRENQTVFKIFDNTDGEPWLTEPFKQKNGYTVSPFVTLDVPA